MNHLLLKIESYSKAFAEKVCNTFFINKEEISGEQIVSLTPIDQVNLFVLKNLFERWHDESYKLKSPYFDYDHSEVKVGMQEFMNVLSRHILIKKEFFRPLLENATYEALILLLEPSLYLKSELGRDGLIVVEDIKNKKKFFKLYKKFWDRISESAKDSISITELQQEIEKEKSAFNTDEYLDRFSTILPMEILTPIVKKEEEPTPAHTSIPAPVPIPAQAPFKSEVVEAPQKLEEKRIEQETIPEVQKEEVKTNEQSIPSLNEKFSSSQRTINDVLAQNQSKTIADQINKGKLENIRSAISLNQKFQFINYLFLGQSSDYETALNEVEYCESFDQAIDLLKQKYGARYHWDYNKTEVKDFISLIEQKFA